MILGGLLLLGFVLAGLTSAFCLGFAYAAYSKYYKRMKDAHRTEWWALMSKDPVVDTAGEWIRWPFGSFQLIASALNSDVYYGDGEILKLKKKIKILGQIGASAFLIFVALIFAFPK